MALTYKLQFKRELEEKKEFKELIEKNNNKYFIISELYSSTDGYFNSNFEGKELEYEFGDSSSISFRVIDKEADQIAFRKSLLDTVHKITNEIYPEEDYYFDFNGDIIHEMRENGVVKRNSKSGFYVEIE